MMQLFIEGQEADIDQAFSTLLTASINDVKSFGTKETTFSKTIILPGTKRNNVLFGNIFNTTTRSAYNPLLPNTGYNFNAAVSAKVLVMNQSIQQMKGTIRLLQINVDGAFIDYEVSIVGELGGFSAKLGANKIEQLDFSEHDHAYSIANIVSSWDNEAAGSGYYYPLTDLGGYGYTAAGVLGGKHSWNHGTFRPALFALEYVNKIFAAAGYTYECPLFTTERFKRQIVPHNQKKLTKLGTALASAVPVNTAYTLDAGLSFGTFSGTDWSLVAGNAITYNGTPTIAVNLKFVLHFTATTTEPGGNNGIYIEVLKNGVPITESHVDIPGWTGDKAVDYEYNGAGLTINTGDYFQIRVQESDALGLGYNTIHDITGSILASSLSATTLNVNLGDMISINDTIPKNILQKDFFAAILKLFNLYVTEDIHTERHMIITPFIDFHNGDSEDWSLLVDRSKPIGIKPMSELNARYYEFKYKDDTDYWNDLYKKRYNETYGSLIYDSGFEFTSEKSGVELIFAPTPLLGYADEEKVYPTIFKKSGEVEETIDSVIRIMQAKKVTGVASWDILGGTLPVSQTFYGYAGHFDDPDNPANDLNFGIPKELFFTLAGGALNVNQFNVYYSAYMAEITDKDSKMLTCTLRLTKKDWYGLSFSTYKWIDGSLWRLNKITDYNATNEDTCKAEFIKLIEKVY